MENIQFNHPTKIINLCITITSIAISIISIWILNYRQYFVMLLLGLQLIYFLINSKKKIINSIFTIIFIIIIYFFFDLYTLFIGTYIIIVTFINYNNTKKHKIHLFIAIIMGLLLINNPMNLFENYAYIISCIYYVSFYLLS